MYLKFSYLRVSIKRKTSFQATMKTSHHQSANYKALFFAGVLEGHRNHSALRRPGQLSVQVREKKNKQSRSFCSFCSDRSVSVFVFFLHRLCWHMHTEEVNHTLSQCIPSFPLSFCLPFISFLLMGGGGGGVSVLPELGETMEKGKTEREE